MAVSGRSIAGRNARRRASQSAHEAAGARRRVWRLAWGVRRCRGV